MNVVTQLILGTIIGLLIVGIIYLFFRTRKKKEIPEEILHDFNEAERRFKEANGSKTHEQILWELAKPHFAGTTANSEFIRRERTVEIRENPRQRTEIQERSPGMVASDIRPEREDNGWDKSDIRFSGRKGQRFRRL